MKKLSLKEWEQLKAEAFLQTTEHPELRIGQCLFNILFEINSELADSVRATDKDPFYASSLLDKRIHRFYDEIVEVK